MEILLVGLEPELKEATWIKNLSPHSEDS